MRLDKIFRNAIVEATEKGGLEPRECTFDFNDDGGCRITHAPSGSSFVLEGDFSRWTTTTVVGEGAPGQLDAYIWPTVEDRAGRWARDVKRDVDTPDLWLVADASRAATPPSTVTNRRLMERAIALARLSDSEPGKVSPRVGAVVVRNGVMLGEAFRGETAPGDHAEFALLEKKLPDEMLAGATLYTTLEPCTTRNHPKVACAERIVERRLRRVVIGVLDPNDAIRGRGELRLRAAGIEIARFDPDLMAQIEELNREFARLHAGAQTPEQTEAQTSDRPALQGPAAAAPRQDQAGAAPEPSQRVFAEAPPEPADVTPASLDELFSGRTNAQAVKLVDQHNGKPVRVSGDVVSVELSPVNRVHRVRIKGAMDLLLFFDPIDGVDAEPIVLSLNEGDRIVASGQIHQLRPVLVSIDQCRLIESRAQTS